MDVSNYVEVFMKVMNGLVIILEEDKRFLCLAVLICEQFCWCQDIDQVLLHEIIFFVSVYSAAVKC